MNLKFETEAKAKAPAHEETRWYLGKLDDDSPDGWYSFGCASIGEISREKLERDIARGAWDREISGNMHREIALVAVHRHCEIFPQVGELDPRQLSREAAIAEVVRLRERIGELEHAMADPRRVDAAESEARCRQYEEFMVNQK